MYPGRDVNVHSYIQVLELCINEGVDANSTDAGLELTSGHRNAIADFQRGLLSIHSANLRVLNDLSGAVIEERRRSSRIDGDCEIGRVQIAETIEVDLIRRA